MQQIDRWENEWFPVVNATLLRRHPEIHARVFLNLSQTEGAAVIISAEIARASTKDRALLRRLGFLASSSSRRRSGNVDDAEDAPESPAVAAASPVPSPA